MPHRQTHPATPAASHLSRLPRATLWVALALVLAATACASDPVTSTTTSATGGAGGSALPDPLPLTVVTWNLKNFINNEIDDDAQFEATDPAWPQHRAAVGAVLRSIDADVVMLQEVEHEGVLNELNQQDLDAAYPFVRVIAGNDPRGIDVGVMSKIGLDDVISHKKEAFTDLTDPQSPSYHYARDCLEVHLTFNGRAVVLLGVHFKAKQNDDPQKRFAEAQHTRAIADAITAAAPASALLILGDFNDLPGSPPYQSVVGSNPDLYANAADEVVATDRWTFTYNGKRELVDQQMANPLLWGLLEPSSAHIVHAPEAQSASDHAPLIATYLIN